MCYVQRRHDCYQYKIILSSHPSFFIFHSQMNVMIQRRKWGFQVRKTSSSNGTYLWPMQGDACGRWKLEGMFPFGYRVSSFKGYKWGFSWLRMQNCWGKWFITQSENRLKAQYCKRGHEMQSQLNAKKCPFLCLLVYLVWKRGKLVPNRHLFKSNLRVWKRQVHSVIFSIFDSELEKSLTKTRDLSNPN